MDKNKKTMWLVGLVLLILVGVMVFGNCVDRKSVVLEKALR